MRKDPVNQSAPAARGSPLGHEPLGHELGAEWLGAEGLANQTSASGSRQGLAARLLTRLAYMAPAATPPPGAYPD